MKDEYAQRSVSCVIEKVDRGRSGKEGWCVDSSSSILLQRIEYHVSNASQWLGVAQSKPIHRHVSNVNIGPCSTRGFQGWLRWERISCLLGIRERRIQEK
jgi:hypothetical protein